MKAIQKREFLNPLEVITERGKKFKIMHPYRYHPLLIETFRKEYKGHHPTIKIFYVRFYIDGNEVYEIPIVTNSLQS